MMTREKILSHIAECDRWLLYMAGEELRASRGHRPGEHPERYRELRAQARHIQKLRTDWFNVIPPNPLDARQVEDFTAALQDFHVRDFARKVQDGRIRS